MKLGTMQGVMGGSDEEVFARAKRLGLKGIEPDLSLENLASESHPRIEVLRALAAKTGLLIPSICLGVFNHAGFVAKPEREAEVVGEIGVAIEWAVKLGAKVVLLPFFGQNDPKGKPDQLKRVAELLRPLCKRAAGRGVCLCFEGTLAAEDFHEMAGLIGSDEGFGVYFDVANVVWVGLDGPEQIRKQASLIRQVHMKETKVGTGDVRPGRGRVDYAASAAALREIGYDGWLMLETPRGTEEEIAEDIAFTKKYFSIS